MNALATNSGVMDIEEIHLAAHERLSDRPPTLRGRRIILEGETGIGKTTYILDHLARTRPVLLLLPTVSQVIQIQQRPAQRAICFAHANSQPEHLQPIIVATYDQLGRLSERLGAQRSRYVLVVDEVHKLYQAGSYRAPALQGIFETIDGLDQPDGFHSLLGLSATIQPTLLDLPIDQWIVVRQPHSPQRQVTIVEYQDLDPSVLIKTLIRQDLLPRERLNVIRLNHAQSLHEFAAFFTTRGYQCLVVHSKIQDEAPVRQMFAEQAVGDYQLLLTTSLMDEGINITNQNLGCVHLIGTVHSGELRQFLGRFRDDNPELFLHIDQLPNAEPPIDLDQEAALMHTRQHAMLTFCQSMLSHEMSTKQTLHYIRQMNATHQRFCGFDLLLARPLASGACDIQINRPGRLAYLYALDTHNHYVSCATLIKRLEAQLGACQIHVSWVGKPVADAVLAADLRAATDVVDGEHQSRLDAIEERLKAAVTDGLYASVQEALEAYVASFARAHTREDALLRALWSLSTYVAADYESAVAILRANRQQGAWRFVKGLDDALIREFHQCLSAYRDEMGVDPEQAVRIPRQTGEALVLQALNRVSQRDPEYRVSAQLLGSRRRGVAYQADGHYVVTPQFVTKLFRDYTDSRIDRRYYHYTSPAWGGYRYAAFVPRLATVRMPKRCPGSTLGRVETLSQLGVNSGGSENVSDLSARETVGQVHHVATV